MFKPGRISFFRIRFHLTPSAEIDRLLSQKTSVTDHTFRYRQATKPAERAISSKYAQPDRWIPYDSNLDANVDGKRHEN
jgi:hypothetical protein